MWSDLPVYEKVLSHYSMPQGANRCEFIRITEGRKRKAMWQWAIMLHFKWVDAPCSWGPNSSTFSAIPEKLLDILQHAIWKHLRVLHSMKLMHSIGKGRGSFMTWPRGNAEKSDVFIPYLWGSLESPKAQKYFHP